MNYNEALSYLDSLNQFGSRLGLERITALLALMGNPERSFKSIHITGSNGKGSTTAMTAAILRQAGVRTGMYISPHLVEYTERMKIDGGDICQADFADAVGRVKCFADQMVAQGAESPTEFEVLTAAAFYYFSAQAVEYAVIEVGLGGLLDSTNVIVPEVAVITNVALEHADRCGGTLAAVAGHKAGIIKHGVAVVTAADEGVLPIIEQQACQQDAALYVLGRDFTVDSNVLVQPGRVAQQLTFRSNYGQFKQAPLNLLGRHQADNAALAVMAALLLGRHDERITLDAVLAGLRTVSWPGRFEILPGPPVVVIDGAHNGAGASVLRDNLDAFFPGKAIVFLLGVLQDKDIAAIVETLVRPNDAAVVTTPQSERAASPALVAGLIGSSKVEIAASLEDSVDKAWQLAHADDAVICVAGSLYLIGYIRAIIQRRQTSC